MIHSPLIFHEARDDFYAHLHGFSRRAACNRIAHSVAGLDGEA
jgi:hypothetical protein